MFTKQTEVDVAIRRLQGPATVTLRYPTDTELLERNAKRSIIITKLGRGETQTSIETEAADHALYQKIAVGAAPELSPAEASKLLESLLRADVSGGDAEGDEVTVKLLVVGGVETSHTLRCPTAEEVINYRKGAYRYSELPFNRSRLRVNLEAAARYYDACFVRVEGYEPATKDGVSIAHKDVVWRAVLEYLDSEVDPQGNF
jgi:hypothetical protein